MSFDMQENEAFEYTEIINERLGTHWDQDDVLSLAMQFISAEKIRLACWCRFLEQEAGSQKADEAEQRGEAAQDVRTPEGKGG